MRIYSITFEQINISSTQDIFEIYFGAGIFKSLEILQQWFNVSDTTLPNIAAFLPIRARILPSTVTHGSGGSTATIGQNDPGDAAASFTAKRNNTTQATTSGTPAIVYDDGFYIFQGHEYMYPKPPRIIGGAGQSFVFELLGIPVSYNIKMSGGLLVAESG